MVRTGRPSPSASTSDPYCSDFPSKTIRGAPKGAPFFSFPLLSDCIVSRTFAPMRPIANFAIRVSKVETAVSRSAFVAECSPRRGRGQMSP